MRIEFFSIILIISITGIVAFAESTDEPESKNSLFIEGVKFFTLGDYEQAISYFDKVIEVDPTNLSALSRKGEALEKLGRFDEAISMYDRLTEIDLGFANENGTLYLDRILLYDNQNINALYKKGKSLTLFNNTLDLAISYFDTVLYLEPKHTNSLYGKAEAYFELEDFDMAIDFYDKALEIDANHIGALSGKGYAFAKLGNYAESDLYTDKALSLEPNNVEALYKKGSSLLAQDKPKEALLYFYKALKIDPKHYQSEIKFEVAAQDIPYKPLDGYVEVWVRDSQGILVSYLKVRNLMYLDNQIFNETINEWPVTKVINRGGQDYELHQHEEVRDVNKRYLQGGASDYGVYFPEQDSGFGIIHSSYWQYEVDAGDTITLKRTAFRPI